MVRPGRGYVRAGTVREDNSPRNILLYRASSGYFQAFLKQGVRWVGNADFCWGIIIDICILNDISGISEGLFRIPSVSAEPNFGEIPLPTGLNR